MTDQQTRREGWYADPLGQADLRWWDSQNWTTQTTSSRAASSRPSAAPLQWADEPTPREASSSANRLPPPAPRPAAEPKFALGSTSASEGTGASARVPGGPDWSPLMLALVRAGDNIVTASAASLPTITVDMAERTYWWDLALDSFPAHPVDLVVHSIPRADAKTPGVAGRYSEPLLWRVGSASHEMSTRVDPALRYKLRRWPDLATLPHSADQLRAMKVLANAQLTIPELGAIADIPADEARALIGTFELMSLLDAVRDPAASK
jgi:Protein of unknown function (DUF2510)